MKALVASGGLALALLVGAGAAAAHDRSSVTFGFFLGVPAYHPPAVGYFYPPPVAYHHYHERLYFVPPGHARHWRRHGHWKHGYGDRGRQFRHGWHRSWSRR